MLHGSFGCWAAAYAQGFPVELLRPSLRAELAPPRATTGAVLEVCLPAGPRPSPTRRGRVPDPDTCWPLSVSHRWTPNLKSMFFQCFPSQANLDGQSYLSAQTFCDQIKELRPGVFNWHPRWSDLACTLFWWKNSSMQLSATQVTTLVV